MQLRKPSDADIESRLLADADSVRRRHKRALVTERLQMDRLRQHAVLVNYGEMALVECLEFTNASAETQTFQIQVRAPGIGIC